MERYYMIEEDLKEPTTRQLYHSYGVGVGGQHFPDLCLEEKPVREFVEQINREQLEQIHLQGAIEDFVQSLGENAEKKENWSK